MAYQSGHSGAISGFATSGSIDIDATVGSWTLERTAQLHDTSVFGTGVRRRVPGVERFVATLEIFIDDSMATGIGEFLPGTAITNLQFKLNGADFFQANCVVERFNPRTAVDGPISATLVLRSNGATTYTGA